MNKDILKKYVSIAVLVLAVILISITYVFILYNSKDIGNTIAKIIDIINPFILGAVIAYIMKSTCNFYERLLLKGMLRSGKRNPKKCGKVANIISVVLAYITWLTAIGLLLWIAIPQIIESVVKFVTSLEVLIPEYYNMLIEWEQSVVADNEMLRTAFDYVIEYAQKWADSDLIPLIENFATDELIPGIITFISSLFDVVIGLVISVFILLGRKSLVRKSVLLLHCFFKKESTLQAVINEFKFADRMFSGFLEGKVIDSTLIGLIYYIVLALLKVPYAPLIAVICGVTNIIPIFGPFIGAVPSVFIILTADPIKVIPFVVFVFVIQFIDGYIIDPHIVGGNIKLSSFSVIFAVILFGGLWGFAGLLVGVPTFAVIYDIIKKVVVKVLKKREKEAVLERFFEEHKPLKVKKKRAAVAVQASSASSAPAATSADQSDDNSSTKSEADSNDSN